MTIYRGPGGSGDATNDATVTAVAAYAAQAATSATNAANSATTSGTSATNSANSASSAAASASAAANSASQAASSQSAAATSATTAANSATSAGTQATNATTQANNAANSATAAATSASSASTSATNAATSASQAATSATNASNSASSALAIYGNTTAMNNAVTSATNSASAAATSASQAAASANDASDEATQAGIYAGQAASSASASANSAANSQAAVGDALALYGSATALQTAVTNAQTSATQSANSATASSASSSAAQTSANSAATSATQSANSATQAAASAASAAAIVTNVSSNRPSVRPSLLLDFQYTKQLDPRITFSRPTTATYYDGKTTVKAEENLLTYSQSLSNAAWVYNDSPNPITANATTAPDGTNTGNLFIPTTSNVYHAAKQVPTMTNGVVYTMSVFGKSKEYNYVYLLTYDGNGLKTTSFNVSAGTIGTVASNHTATITATANGWYRCTITFTLSSSNTGMYFGVSNADNTPSYAGDGTSGAYIWGAQLEQRSTVTAYTPTTTAPITNYIPALQTAVSNDARFDHDPVTGESKGLLIEEQRTNLFTSSSDFSLTGWNPVNLTVQPDVIVAPDGTQTGDKLIPNAGNAQHRIQPSSAMTSGTAYTLSVYAKAGGYSSVWLRVAGGALSANFDLTTGTIWGVSGSGTYSITPVGNGWYRCSVTGTAASTGSLYSYINVQNGSDAFIGDGYSGIYIWGAQLEAGSFPTSYIPTVASQVTRSADSASMTGSNFSSWFNQNNGSLYAEFVTPSITPANSFAGVLAASNGTTSTEIDIRVGFSNIICYSTSSLSNTSVTAGSATSNTYTKASFGYALNDFAASRNGAACVTVSSGYQAPALTQLVIGDLGNNVGTYKINGTIKRIAYYPKRLSNTELQGLTS